VAPAGQTHQQPSAETSSSGALPGSKLPTGKTPLRKAFGLGQKAANQPAFIRIGGDKPRTVRNVTQPAVATVSAQGKALLQRAVAHAAALREASSSASPAAAAAGPAAGPNAAPAALPATPGAVAAALPAADLTSGSAANQPPMLQQGGRTEHVPGIAPEGKDTVYAAADTSTAGGGAHDSVPLLSEATDQRAAAQAATSRSQDGEAVTAAPDVPRGTQDQCVTQEAMPILIAAPDAPVSAEAAEVSPRKAANLATALPVMVESSAATATPPVHTGDVTPEPAVMQSPVGQQMLLPTSRRKRKGQKAAKVVEPARGNSSWQELVELSGAAEPAAALAGNGMSGQYATGLHVQDAVKRTSYT